MSKQNPWQDDDPERYCNDIYFECKIRYHDSKCRQLCKHPTALCLDLSEFILNSETLS